jgi:hypothetical protein
VVLLLLPPCEPVQQPTGPLGTVLRLFWHATRNCCAALRCAARAAQAMAVVGGSVFLFGGYNKENCAFTGDGWRLHTAAVAEHLERQV